MKKYNPSVEANLFRSMENIHLSAVLGYKDTDKKYHNFLEWYEEGEDSYEEQQKDPDFVPAETLNLGKDSRIIGTAWKKNPEGESVEESI